MWLTFNIELHSVRTIPESHTVETARLQKKVEKEEEETFSLCQSGIKKENNVKCLLGEHISFGLKGTY